jgi:hypothetical protein
MHSIQTIVLFCHQAEAAKSLTMEILANICILIILLLVYFQEAWNKFQLRRAVA